jgi:peptide/nickel transport system substrate-binding protein
MNFANWRRQRRSQPGREDVARPIIFYSRGGTCWQPYVKNLTLKVNSIYAGNRREDIWLDK